LNFHSAISIRSCFVSSPVSLSLSPNSFSFFVHQGCSSSYLWDHSNISDFSIYLPPLGYEHFTPPSRGKADPASTAACRGFHKKVGFIHLLTYRTVFVSQLCRRYAGLSSWSLPLLSSRTSSPRRHGNRTGRRDLHRARSRGSLCSGDPSP